jgi:hypothetical protein
MKKSGNLQDHSIITATQKTASSAVAGMRFFSVKKASYGKYYQLA